MRIEMTPGMQTSSLRKLAAFGLAICLIALVLHPTAAAAVALAAFILLPVALFGLVLAPRSLWPVADPAPHFALSVFWLAELFQRPPPFSLQ